MSGIEGKVEYYQYIQELERMGVCSVYNAAPELSKKFPHLNEAAAERLINLYIKEELECYEK